MLQSFKRPTAILREKAPFMSHDQLFKDLLRAFFREFLELFFPQIAVRLDFSQVRFLDKELFTDLPEGKQHEADLVVEVSTLDGQPEIILIHGEVERQRRGTFPERMHDYYRMLRLRHRHLVYPIVVYLSPGTGGVKKETHTDILFGEEIERFTYTAIGLPDLSADDYRDVDNPLASGLSALMRVSALGKAVQKVGSLRKIAQSTVDEARKFLLINTVETYLTLDTSEEAEFQGLVTRPGTEEVREMISVYEERGIVKGLQRRLLKEMHRKFGELSPEVIAKVEATHSEREIDILLDKVEVAATIADMELV